MTICSYYKISWKKLFDFLYSPSDYDIKTKKQEDSQLVTLENEKKRILENRKREPTHESPMRSCWN